MYIIHCYYKVFAYNVTVQEYIADIDKAYKLLLAN